MGVDTAEPATQTGQSRRSSRKRKAVSYAQERSDDVSLYQHVPLVDLTADDGNKVQSPAKKKARRNKDVKATNLTNEEQGEDAKIPTKSKPKDEEKRLKRHRKQAPQSYDTFLERATTQRMFVIDRSRSNNADCPHNHLECPSETIDLAGSTGNIYQVTITHLPTCTCPNFRGGNAQCKHIVYVLNKVLKAPMHLQYQLAFLTSELMEIFEHAGPLPTDTVEKDKDGNRKPVEGDCGICCCELEPEAEEIVWCKAACGNNLHKTCFDQWAASKRGGRVTCPFCREQWREGDAEALKNVSKAGPTNYEGYVNVASQLGLSGQRDYSTYHPFWVRRETRAGRI